MIIGVEALFTSALGLKSPWGVNPVNLDTSKRRINFEIDCNAKRLPFPACAMEGQRILDRVKRKFKEDLIEHGGDPDDIKHVCMDMSAAYTTGVTEISPQAQISFDRFHVIALANAAMDKVRRGEMRQQPRVVKAALGTDRKSLKGMFWGMRKDHSAWNVDQINTMYRLQRSNLKSARAWRPKEGLRSCYILHVYFNPEEIMPFIANYFRDPKKSGFNSLKHLREYRFNRHPRESGGFKFLIRTDPACAGRMESNKSALPFNKIKVVKRDAMDDQKSKKIFSGYFSAFKRSNLCLTNCYG